jgi:hypothetical protein
MWNKSRFILSEAIKLPISWNTMVVMVFVPIYSVLEQTVLPFLVTRVEKGKHLNETLVVLLRTGSERACRLRERETWRCAAQLLYEKDCEWYSLGGTVMPLAALGTTEQRSAAR